MLGQDRFLAQVGSRVAGLPGAHDSLSEPEVQEDPGQGSLSTPGGKENCLGMQAEFG